MWPVKSLNSAVPAKRVDASGSKRGECCSQCSFGKRRSMIYGILTGLLVTQENTHMSKWEEEKEKTIVVRPQPWSLLVFRPV